MVIDPEQKRAALEKAVKWGVIGIGLAATASIAWWVVEGLIAWAALGLVALVIVNFAPAVATWFANKRIQALVAVIEANPIETMQNLYEDKMVEFRKQEAAVTEFDAQFRNVSDLVENLKRTDPDEAGQYLEMRDKMKEGLVELRAEQTAAKGELHNAELAIDKMKRLWTVGCAMNTALAASESAQSKFYAKMKQDVAVDTVRTNLNRAFANLNTAVERRRNAALFDTPKEAAKALPEGVVDAEVIDLTKVGQRATKGIHA